MKNYIRLILLVAVVILSVTALVAQTKDIVYLKNGSVIKGTILEMIPDKTIKIQTADGNIFVYNMSEVDKISKEAATPTTETKPAVERPSNEGQRSYESQRNLEGQSSNEGAGTKFSIFGGAALPMGDFGKMYDVNATNDENSGKGNAKTGWSAGMQLVTGGTIGFLIEGSYSQNKIEVSSDEMSYINLYYGSGKLEYTGWTSILALAGIKIGTDNSSGANFFIAPLAGALFGKSPEVTFTATGTSTSTTLQPAASGTGFAYGGAVELILGGHVTLSGKYIVSKPKFKWSEPLYTGGPSKDYEREQNISLLLVSLGIAF